MADVNLNFKINYGGDPTAPLKEVEVQVKGIEGAFKKLGASTGDIFKGAFGANLAIAALGELKNAIGSAVDFIGGSITAAQEAEKAQTAFAVAISDTSKNISQSVADFDSFAKGLSQVTAVEDDAIVKAGALIGQLTKLSDQGLKQATEAAVNLSVALGVDLDTAAQQVAKAANGNVTSFQKLGLEIKKGNTDAETFANTLKALSTFQGAASAQAQTFGGATAKLSNSFGNFREEIGNTIIKNQAFVNVINVLSDLFGRLTNLISANSKEIANFFSVALIASIDVVAGIAGVLDSLIRIFDAAFNTIKASVLAFATVAIAPFATFSETARNLVEQFASESVKAVKDVGKSFTEDSSLGGFIQNLGELKGAAEQGFGVTAKGAADTVKPIKDATAATKELTEAQKKLAEEGARLTAEKVKAALPEQNASREVEALKLANEQKLTTDLEYLIAKEQIETEARAREVESLLAQNEALATIGLDANAAEIAANQAKIDTIIAQETVGSQLRLKQEADAKKQRDSLKKQEQEEQQRKLQLTSQFFGNLATLTQTGNEELFAIGKAAALAQATIDGYAAIQKALASAPPPFNYALAASVGIATGVQIAKISATKLATGIDSVPAGFQNDNFPAFLQTGERVVPAKTNEDLTAFLASRDVDTSLLAEISSKLDRLSPQVNVQIGEKEVFGVIRDGLNAGRAFA